MQNPYRKVLHSFSSHPWGIDYVISIRSFCVCVSSLRPGLSKSEKKIAFKPKMPHLLYRNYNRKTTWFIKIYLKINTVTNLVEKHLYFPAHYSSLSGRFIQDFCSYSWIYYCCILFKCNPGSGNIFQLTLMIVVRSACWTR